MRKWPRRQSAPNFHWGSEGQLPLEGSRIVVCNWRDSTHPRAGGAELYTEQVARRLAAMGARVTYLTSRSPGARRREPAPWGEIVRLGGTLGTYPLVLAWLALHRNSIDGILDSQNGIPYFAPLAVGDRVPVVMLVHHVHQDQFDLYFPRPLNVLGRVLEKRGSQLVYGGRPICAVSPSTRAAVRRRLKLKGPIFLAPNGHEESRLVDAGERSEEPTIVSVGRLVPHKRVHLLVEAMPEILRHHPGARLEVVGDGEARPDLEARVATLEIGHAVTFHGRLDDHRRDALVARAWLTVNPSAGEGWGLSVIEAAAMGVPAVAFRVPGLEDSIRAGETGWLIEADESLAEAVSGALSALQEPEAAELWAKRCRHWASLFTWEAAAERISSVMISEAERIERRYDERRNYSDTATIVALPPEVARAAALRRLRDTDQVRVDEAAQRVELLLVGADEVDTTGALNRIGINPRDTYWSRVARYRDLLGWQSKWDYLRQAGHAGAEDHETDPAEMLLLDMVGVDEAASTTADRSPGDS